MPGKRRKLDVISGKKPSNSENNDEDSSIADNEEVKSEFEIESIQDFRITDSKIPEIEFKVRWRGFGDDDSTWEPFADLSQTAGELLEAYLSNLMREKTKQIQLKTFEKEMKQFEMTQVNNNNLEINKDSKIRIISSLYIIYYQCCFSSYQEEGLNKIGYLIDVIDETHLCNYRIPIDENELIKTHSQQMYEYLKSQIYYESKIIFTKSELIVPHSQQILEEKLRNNSKFKNSEENQPLM